MPAKYPWRGWLQDIRIPVLLEKFTLLNHALKEKKNIENRKVCVYLGYLPLSWSHNLTDNMN